MFTKQIKSMQSYSHTTKEFLVQQSKRTFTITIIISSLLMFVSCSPFTPKDKGKVIILSGQSNATGNAWNMYLSEEEQQKYSRGFDNVYINARNSLTENNTEFFTPVTFGWGENKDTFGPELGLSEVLSTEFEEEKFYIIKYSYSGAGLSEGPFNPINPGFAFSELLSHIDSSLNKLKQMNLEPEIVAFCWMQGETDALSLSYAEEYYENEKALIDTLRNKYASSSIVGGMYFIDGAINGEENTIWTYHEIVNGAKKRLSEENNRNIYLDTNALFLTAMNEPIHNPDYAHYDSSSELELGRAFGKVIINILKTT